METLRTVLWFIYIATVLIGLYKFNKITSFIDYTFGSDDFVETYVLIILIVPIINLVFLTIYLINDKR